MIKKRKRERFYVKNGRYQKTRINLENNTYFSCGNYDFMSIVWHKGPEAMPEIFFLISKNIRIRTQSELNVIKPFKMDVCEETDTYCILEEASQDNLEICESTSDINTLNAEGIEGKLNDGSEKPCAVWTSNATTTLLKLYENKLEMLETPKKKTRIWIAISQSLSEYGIEMSPDQVRWKINALTKKYKQCVDSGQHDKFKYFKIMNDIYAQYHVDCDSYTLTELLHKKKNGNRMNATNEHNLKLSQESKAVIEMRKIRLANRIESDRTQGKIQLEKQWLEYLQRQEEQKQWRDEIYDRNLKLREEELELRRKELEIKETLELKKIQLKEKEYRETLQIEREKCELLKEIFSKRY